MYYFSVAGTVSEKVIFARLSTVNFNNVCCIPRQSGKCFPISLGLLRLDRLN